MKRFKLAVNLIRSSKHLVVVSGAGVSVESGIPAFRGESGLWTRFDPQKYASLDGFTKNPGRSWHLFMELLVLIAQAKPNAAHHDLASLERCRYLKAIITQNIDGFHQLAGSQNVIEIHGTMRNLICTECKQRLSSRGMIFDSEDLPPICPCGGILKPEALLFGESIPSKPYFKSLKQIRLADVVLLIGTSGVVHPVSEFPEIALRHGARLIEINPEESVFTRPCNTLHLKGKATTVLGELKKALTTDSKEDQ